MDLLRFKVYSAKKEHVCNYCGFKIIIGEKYIYQPIKGDHFYIWKSHSNCQLLAEKLNMFDECDEGVTDDDFSEFVNEQYLNKWDNSEIALKTWKERLEYVFKIHHLT